MKNRKNNDDSRPVLNGRPLTEQELRMIELNAKDIPVKNFYSYLGNRPATAQTEWSRLLNKAGVRNRLELFRATLRSGFDMEGHYTG